MSTVIKNTLAGWIIDRFPDARDEGLDYLRQFENIEIEDNENKKSKLSELEKSYPFTSTKNYFIVKIVSFVNKRPVFAILLVVGILYNVVFYTVKAAQAIAKFF